MCETILFGDNIKKSSIDIFGVAPEKSFNPFTRNGKLMQIY
jgi:hypothetical protein